ncbi:hypothetical protein [Mycobacterium uberis]|uniref:hypothetical protein n=1 Tax=Mycobacterium uberis TaxID=2162698 RepID=UPI001FB3F7E0|nr:hypothetical protein [Mycobacterium uberis]
MTSISTDAISTVAVPPTTIDASVRVKSHATPRVTSDASGSVVLDHAHSGDIVGVFGHIERNVTRVDHNRRQQLRLLMVIIGPGLIAITGDNDAGGVATYAQVGQSYWMSSWCC